MDLEHIVNVLAVKTRILPGRYAPTYEVEPSGNGMWYVHERAANGKIKNVSQLYPRKSTAVRQAFKDARAIPGAKVKVF